MVILSLPVWSALPAGRSAYSSSLLSLSLPSAAVVAAFLALAGPALPAPDLVVAAVTSLDHMAVLLRGCIACRNSCSAGSSSSAHRPQHGIEHGAHPYIGSGFSPKHRIVIDYSACAAAGQLAIFCKNSCSAGPSPSAHRPHQIEHWELLSVGNDMFRNYQALIVSLQSIYCSAGSPSSVHRPHHSIEHLKSSIEHGKLLSVSSNSLFQSPGLPAAPDPPPLCGGHITALSIERLYMLAQYGRPSTYYSSLFIIYCAALMQQ